MIEAEDYLPRDVIGDNLELRYGGSVVLIIPGAVDAHSVTYWGCGGDGQGIYLARLKQAPSMVMRHVANVQFGRMREVDEAIAEDQIYVADNGAALFHSDDGQRIVVKNNCGRFGLWQLHAIGVVFVGATLDE